MDQPGASKSDHPEICKICNTERRRYICPKCEIQYCSLECYKSERHSECSEHFYKQWVESELKSREQDPADRRKIMDILTRMQTSDIEFDADAVGDAGLIDDDEEFRDATDSDDNEDLPDLETRLLSIDLNNADEVWSALTDAERQDFEASVRNGEAAKLLPQWTPWWCDSFTGSKLIEELIDDDGERPGDFPQRPAIVDVPTFNELAKASPCVRFNLTNVLHAYAYMALSCNGEHRNTPRESATVFLRLSENMGQNRVFEDSISAIESVSRRVEDSGSLPEDETTMAATKEAVKLIVAGPDQSNSSFYALTALSDLHALFLIARKEFPSANRGKSADRAFSTRFRIGESRAEVSNKTLLLCTKKIEYYLSWVKSYGIRLNE